MPIEDDDMHTDNFDSGLKGELDIICNIVFVLPIEFDQITEVTEEEDDCFVEEIENHKPICYHIMNNGCLEEEKFIFDRPNEEMKQHIKPLFIWAKVDGVCVNKVLVDEGDTIYLMSKSQLRRIGKTYTNLRPHNMVLSDYEGKTSKAL